MSLDPNMLPEGAPVIAGTSQTGWSTASLKALMDERDVRYQQRFSASQEALTNALAAQEKAVAAALMAADRAVAKAEAASEKRFEGVNEFRSALADQQSKLMPRIEAENRFTAMLESLGRLEKWQASQSGEAHRGETLGRSTMTVVALVITTFISVASLAFSAYNASVLRTVPTTLTKSP